MATGAVIQAYIEAAYTTQAVSMAAADSMRTTGHARDMHSLYGVSQGLAAHLGLGFALVLRKQIIPGLGV